MGDIADSMIDGQFDYITGEYIGDPVGYPRRIAQESYFSGRKTPSEKKIASIRKEIYLLVQEKCKFYTTDAEKNRALDEARREMNLKYGKGWRERGLISNDENQWTEEELAPFIKNKK